MNSLNCQGSRFIGFLLLLAVHLCASAELPVCFGSTADAKRAGVDSAASALILKAAAASATACVHSKPATHASAGFDAISFDFQDFADDPHLFFADGFQPTLILDLHRSRIHTEPATPRIYAIAAVPIFLA